MATHSSVLAWRIPGTRSLVGCRLWVTQSRTRLKQLSSRSSSSSSVYMLYIVACICQSQTLDLSLTPFFIGYHVCFLCLWVYFCLACCLDSPKSWGGMVAPDLDGTCLSLEVACQGLWCLCHCLLTPKPHINVSFCSSQHCCLCWIEKCISYPCL